MRDSGAAASRLYVSVGEKRLALGIVSTTRPFCPIRFTSLSPETTFSCEGGELLLSGVVLNDDMYDDFAEPPSKKPRMEAPAETPRPASPKTAPKAKAAAPSPKAATPAPKAATPAPAPKKEAKASDKAVTQRTLPSGLRYEVLQRGNGPQAIVGKPVTWDLSKIYVRILGLLGLVRSMFVGGIGTTCMFKHLLTCLKLHHVLSFKKVVCFTRSDTSALVVFKPVLKLRGESPLRRSFGKYWRSLRQRCHQIPPRHG